MADWALADCVELRTPRNSGEPASHFFVFAHVMSADFCPSLPFLLSLYW